MIESADIAAPENQRARHVAQLRADLDRPLGAIHSPLPDGLTEGERRAVLDYRRRVDDVAIRVAARLSRKVAR